MTSPTSYTKFGFDTEFFELVQGQPGSSGVPVAAGSSTGPATPAQMKVQLEEARQQAYAEGMAAGVAEGLQQAQADLAQLQQHLQNALMAMQTTQAQREEQLLNQTLSLMRVTLHHLVGQIAQAYGPEMLEHHLRQLLPLLKAEEMLTLRIHPAARGFHEKLGLPQAAIMGMPMHIVNDPQLGTTDAIVEWANGGAESKLAQHLMAVDVMLAGAGAQMLNVEHKTNLNPLPQPVPVVHEPVETPVVQVQAPLAPPVDDLEAAAAMATKARADALLGDEDDLVDALK